MHIIGCSGLSLCHSIGDKIQGFLLCLCLCRMCIGGRWYSPPSLHLVPFPVESSLLLPCGGQKWGSPSSLCLWATWQWCSSTCCCGWFRNRKWGLPSDLLWHQSQVTQAHMFATGYETSVGVPLCLSWIAPFYVLWPEEECFSWGFLCLHLLAV